MKTLLRCGVLAAGFGLAGLVGAAPVGTAFTYQGRLADGGKPANGLYDFSFGIWDALNGSSQLGSSFNTNSLLVTNGLFTVTLDFGNVFDGNARWLAISVRTNGAPSFSALTPRQPLMPQPHVSYASNAAAAASASLATGLSSQTVSNAGFPSGAVTAGKLAGGQVVKSLNGLADAVTLSGSDASLTVTPAGNALVLWATNNWLLSGNSGTTNAVLGTLDWQPLDLVVDGRRGFHLEISSVSANEVNVVGGSGDNAVSSGISGATILGGGSYEFLYLGGRWRIYDGHQSVAGYFGTIEGGYSNSLAVGADYSTILGGIKNQARTNATLGFVGGGMNNWVGADAARVGGGTNNNASGFAATVGGGAQNAASGAGATIGGGGLDGSAYGGNVASGAGATIAGGLLNLASGSRATVGGGYNNAATNWYATVPGGAGNIAGGMSSFAAGQNANALHDGTFVWGDNSTSADILTTGANQFLVRAAGGVGIGTTVPTTPLEVSGQVKAAGYQGSGALSWQVPAGTSVQAQPNCGYVVTNAAQVTVTLPTAPALGDVVRITGAGAGGWKSAQNPGQQILFSGAGIYTGDWSAYTNYGMGGVAASADGSKLIALGQDYYPYLSTNYGSNWIRQNVLQGYGVGLSSVASSADGSRLFITTPESWYNGTLVSTGHVYTSTDSGITWTSRLPKQTGYTAIASSADGLKLLLAYGPNTFGCLYTSSDGGTNWTQRYCGAQWSGVASSTDGVKLAACAWGGGIYTSSNAGVDWVLRTNTYYFTAVASSADGSKLVAVENGGNTTNGIMLRSADYGATWKLVSSAGSNNWRAVTSSADGTRLAAVDFSITGPAPTGRVHVSCDSGATWSLVESSRLWNSIASSADGGLLVAGVTHYTTNGGVYVSSRFTSTGATGYLAGPQSSAVELQCVSTNQFLAISHEGTLSAH
jgi:hypothetical protein